MGEKSAVPVLVLAVVLLAPAASSATAQSHAFLRFGNTFSDDDPFCEDPAAAITMFSVGVSAPLAGFSLEYNNGDYPWPPPPDNGNGDLFLTHGTSLQFMAEVNPAYFVARGLSDHVRPFVGVGLHISTDGEARDDTGAGPAWGVKGQTRPFVAYGVNGFVPVGSRFGLTAGYRGTTVFFGDFQFDTPSGAVIETDGESLSSSSWTFGFAVQFGGN